MSTLNHSKPTPSRKKSRMQRPSFTGLKLDGPHKAAGDSSSHANSKASGPFFKKHSHTLHLDEKSMKSSSMLTAGSNFYNRRLFPVENTYKINPETFFPQKQVEAIIKSILEENLSKVIYASENIGVLSRHISELIKHQVGKLRIERFKIVVWVSIHDRKSGGDIRIASRCLWNDSCDNYASEKFENETLSAVANVYAIYYE